MIFISLKTHGDSGNNCYRSPFMFRCTVEKLVLVQPSSAAAERVFSLFVTMFGVQQHDALKDMIEAALMLRVNGR